MKVRLFALIFTAALTLSACATVPEPTVPEPNDGVARATIGNRVYVDGPAVTPLEVLEDSRCPEDVMCVWAGRLRLKVRVHLGSRDEVHELILGTPTHVADGNIELVEATPGRVVNETIKPGSYRFGFRFMGGI